jgi:phosphonate degradation associated HDIG domain protein
MTLESPTKDTIIDLIAEIFERRGSQAYLGEEVTMSEHMLQTAWLAEEAGASDAMAAAALLHDIGHFAGAFPEDWMEKGFDNHHDAAGARILEPFFPPAITEPVRLHVAAKRYLCAAEPKYFARLSRASIRTLELQGGPMIAAEVAALEQEPYREAAVSLRRWDEGAKVKDRITAPFSHYYELLRGLVKAPAGDSQLRTCR